MSGRFLTCVRSSQHGLCCCHLLLLCLLFWLHVALNMQPGQNREGTSSDLARRQLVPKQNETPPSSLIPSLICDWSFTFWQKTLFYSWLTAQQGKGQRSFLYHIEVQLHWFDITAADFIYKTFIRWLMIIALIIFA